MTFTGGSLADGQLAATWGTIYAPGASKAIVKSVDIFSTHADPQTVELRVTRSGSSPRLWKRAELNVNESAAFLTDGETLVLSPSDILEAQTTNATSVDYTITGATE